MSEDDDKIKRLNVQFKKPPEAEGVMLKVVESYATEGACNHRWFFAGSPLGGGSRMVNVTYLIREGETEVECSHCHTKLDPMFVLRRMAHEETHWQRSRAQYIEEMERLKGRSRTQCDNCGKMTRISRTKPPKSANA